MKGGSGSHTKPTHDDNSGRHGPAPLRRRVVFPWADDADHLPSRGGTLLTTHYADGPDSETAFEEFVHEIRPWMMSRVAYLDGILNLDEIVEDVLIAIYNQAPRNHAHAPHRKCIHNPRTHLHPGRAQDQSPTTDNAHAAETKGWYEPTKPLQPWLIVLLRNRVISTWRRVKPTFEFNESVHGAAAHEDHWWKILWDEAMSVLTPLERHIMAERRDGLTFEEIAKQHHCSPANIHKINVRAVAKIRALANVADHQK
jgi:DNA-binding CsgD family transcriptional regulator